MRGYRADKIAMRESKSAREARRSAKIEEFFGKERSRPHAVWICFLPFFLVSLVLSIRWVGNLRRVAEASAWPSVDGTVVATSVAGGQRRFGSSYSVIVDVDYRVEGRQLSAFSQEMSAASWSLDEAIRNRPLRGSAIRIWYDPADPTRTTLVHVWDGWHNLQVLVLAACWVPVFITCPFLFPAVRRKALGAA